MPESRRAQCLKVLSCLRVDDDEVRRACIDAAQSPAPEAARSPQEQPHPDEAPVHQEAPILREQQVEPPKRDASRSVRDEAPDKEDAAPEREPEREKAQAPAPSPVRNAAQSEPPDEWNGAVSRIYQSILDRQLIAVDGKYLFESDRASHARLKAGERVAVEKVSSRFFRGSRRWRISGPSRTQIVAFRIHCESEDIRADDRRKCAQMLDR